MSDFDGPVYFISDLHLEASRTDIVEAFEYFLQHIAMEAKRIYILGDFFDAWIGDDNRSTFIEHIKSLLKKTVARGTRIFFVHGNRDFLVGKAFCEQTGVKLLAETTVVKLCGENVLLLHGDSLCTSDIDYQKFRKKVRAPQWQKKMLSYPLFVRKAIAAFFRARSRRVNANKAENIMDVDAKSVEQAFRDFSVSKMIHGHTHRPGRHQYNIGGKLCERIVLGDWETHGWYLKAKDSDLNLIKFPFSN